MIPVCPRHVGHLANAEKTMASRLALVNRTTSAPHQIVDRNVLSTLIVPVIWHVLTKNAKIPVRDHVVLMLNV